MTGRRKRGTQPAHRLDSQSGIALLLALLIILSLTALSLSVVLFTQSESRLGNTFAAQSQAYYAAVAGLEEARGRLNPSAVDAIATTQLPTQVNQVLYLVNSSSQDPVSPTNPLSPTNPSSPYYDYEYAQEFPGGFGAAQVLTHPVYSDQPGATTSYVIPYKWVRITLETEYASKIDVNQWGFLNPTTCIDWDGTNQYLCTNPSCTNPPYLCTNPPCTNPPCVTPVPIYMLTALAVEPNGVRKMVQSEVVGTPPLIPAAGVGTAGSATLTGLSTGPPNLTLNGNDYCGVQNLPAIAAGPSPLPSGLTSIQGSLPEPPYASFALPTTGINIIQSLPLQAVPILYADPTHVTLASGGGSLVGTNVVLGQLPGHSSPGQPAVVYANQSLAISGPASTGYGILLVNGNLSITDGFRYEGLIVSNGTVTITTSSAGNIRIHGSLTSSGNLSINSSASPSTSVWINYNSCAVANSFQSVPLRVRSFKELSF